MKRLIITGTSIVSPIGVGRENVWHAAESAASGIGRLTRFPMEGDIRCGEIRDFDPADYIADRRFRRAAPISQYALASIGLALGECPMEANRRTALVMGITHGALGYTQSFHKELVEGSPESASPLHFSDSVLNAPAGNASICFGIMGPVHTVLGGPEAAVKSIMTACRMIDSGEIDKAVVAAAEELNELSLSCYARLGYPTLGEGAGTIIIERDKDSTQAGPHCCIAGVASGCNPSDPDSALPDVLNLCLDRAGMRVRDIDLVMTDMRAKDDPILKDIPAAALSHLTGFAFAAGMLWEVVFSAMAVRKGSIPQSVTAGGAIAPACVRNVLVCMADRRGSAAAVILTKHE